MITTKTEKKSENSYRYNSDEFVKVSVLDRRIQQIERVGKRKRERDRKIERKIGRERESEVDKQRWKSRGKEGE